LISKKTIAAWVFSAIVSVGMFAVPGKALANDWDHGHGWHHAVNEGGWHGWDNHRRADECARPGYRPPVYGYGYQRSYNQGWVPPVSDYNAPAYGYNNYSQPAYGYNNYSQPTYGYNNYGSGLGIPADGQGMVDPRHPGLVWTCNSGGHHCHWTPRPGYRANSRALGNPFAYGNLNNGRNLGRYSSANNYANGYYGNSQAGMGSLLGPLFGQRP
jgi:hypothetical protein